MPSIIGNSTIFGGSGKTGPRGPTGNSGNIGGIGPLGTSGPRGLTGATGIYIAEVTSDLTNNTITFIPSDGSASISLFGFTGDVGYYSDSRGISASISSGYFSALSSVVGGNTFEFLGISGSGTIVSSLSTDKNEVILTITPAASGPSYGNTASNFVAYTNSSYSVTNTKIGITGSNSILSFGLTADDGATGNSVKVYTDFTETYFGITGGITLGYSPSSVVLNSVVVGADSGGLILNLNNHTTYKMTTPIGITSFVNSGVTGIVSYTFFIEGADVWNFPKNVSFENSASGIYGSDFLDGMNILHLWSDGGSLFNAAFVAKGLGSEGTAYSSRVGSCGYSGGCIDYTSPTECAKLSGVFSPQAKCIYPNINCCINNKCYTTSSNICSAYGGIILSTCDDCFDPSYNLILSDLLGDNTFVVPNTNKLFTLGITYDSRITSSPHLHFSNTIGAGLTTFRFFEARLPNGVTVDNLKGLTGGTTLGFYFNNDKHPSVNGTTGIFNISLKGSSLTSSLGLTSADINFSYYSGGPSSGCSGCLSGKLISTDFTTTRYCKQCYITDDYGLKKYFAVQSQKGNITFCVAPSDCGFTYSPQCVYVGYVLDLDGCTLTDDLTPIGSCDSATYPCYHKDYKFLSDNCSRTDGGPCCQKSIPGIGLVCSRGGETTDYWYNIEYDSDLLFKLQDTNISGATMISLMLKDNIKQATKDSNKLLYTVNNQNKGITYSGVVTSCCTGSGSPLTDALDFSSNYRYFVYLFSTQITERITGAKETNGGSIQTTSTCDLYKKTNDHYVVLVRAKEIGATTPPNSISINPLDTSAGSCCIFISKISTYKAILDPWIADGVSCVDILNKPIDTNFEYNTQWLGELKPGSSTSLNTRAGLKYWNWYPAADYNSRVELFQKILDNTNDKWIAMSLGTIPPLPFRYDSFELPPLPLPEQTEALRKFELHNLLIKPLICNIGDLPTLCGESSSTCKFSNMPIFTNLNEILDQTSGDFSCSENKIILVNVSGDNREIIKPMLYEANASGNIVLNTTATLYYYTGLETTTGFPTKIISNTPITITTEPACGPITQCVFYYTDGTNIDFVDSGNITLKKYKKAYYNSNTIELSYPYYDFIITVGIDSIKVNTRDIDVADNSVWIAGYVPKIYYKRELDDNTWAYGVMENTPNENEYVFLPGEINWDTPENTEKVYTDNSGRRYIIFYVYSSLMFSYIGDESCPLTDRLLEKTKSIKIYGKPENIPWSSALVSVIKNKKIDNTCITIDCTGIERYCNTLEDC